MRHRLAFVSGMALLAAACAGPRLSGEFSYEQYIDWAETLWSQGDQVRAVQIYGRAWTMRPYDIDRLILYGDRAARIGNYKWSINFYRQAEAHARDNPPALVDTYQGMAQTYRLIGRHPEAQYYESRARQIAARMPYGPPPRMERPPSAGPPVRREYRPAPPEREFPAEPPEGPPRVAQPPRGAPRPPLRDFPPYGPDEPEVRRLEPAPEPSAVPELREPEPAPDERQEREVLAPAESTPPTAPKPEPAAPPKPKVTPGVMPPSVTRLDGPAPASSPWPAVVTRVEGNEVTFQAGTKAGVRFGDRFVIFSAEGPADQARRIGELEVVNVTEDTAVGRAFNTTEAIEPKDRVVRR